MKKTLIVFASSHGTTRKAVRYLKELLPGEVQTIELEKEVFLDFEEYETVILGGSIHAGRIQPRFKQFIKQNHNILLTKKLGLFICCMREGETAQKQFETAFPQDLRNHASASGLFGGEFLFDEMNFFERQVVKKVSGTTESVFQLDFPSIRNFAATLNQKVPSN